MKYRHFEYKRIENTANYAEQIQAYKHKPAVLRLEECACDGCIYKYLCRTTHKGSEQYSHLRSRSLESVLVAIIAGTEQPNPISIGTKLLPERPSFLSGLSITNATRAI